MTYPLTHFPRYQLLGQGKRNEKMTEYPCGNQPTHPISFRRRSHVFDTHILQTQTIYSRLQYKCAKLSIIIVRRNEKQTK